MPPAAENVVTGRTGRRTESRRRSSARWPPKTRLSSLSYSGDGGPGNAGWALRSARTPSAPSRILDASSARWCHPGAVKDQAPTVARIQTASATQGQAAPATRRQLGSRPRPGGTCFRGRRCGTVWRSGESPGGDAYAVAFRYLVAGLRPARVVSALASVRPLLRRFQIPGSSFSSPALLGVSPAWSALDLID